MKTTARRHAVRDEYLELVKTFPLCVIRTEAAHAAAIKMYVRLTGRGVKLSAGEREYADALSLCIEDYERREHPLSLLKSSPIERLKYVMEQSGSTQRDLIQSLGVSQPLVSQILNGNRSLTPQHMRLLGERFKLSPGYFL
jgi:HTH-type transcriptional regulator/antitoxin HigA